MKAERTFGEIKDRAQLSGAYEVYKDCLFQPTPEKYERKLDAYWQRESIKVYGCWEQGQLRGLLVLELLGEDRAEILGIAVAESARRRGIASYMMEKVQEFQQLRLLLAETDDEAVGFYESCGFEIEAFAEIYDGQPVTRYRCQLRSKEKER